MSKIDSMLAILWMLNSGRKMTAQQISERLEMNIRTVYRYIDTLSASGVPIISDAGHHGGYTLLHRFIESPLLFHVDEQAALLHAADFAEQAGYYGGKALDRAAAKLKQYSNPEQITMINQRLEGFEVIQTAGRPRVEPALDLLAQSIVSKNAVLIEYDTRLQGKPRQRMLDPYGILYWNHNWYVIGYCHFREEIRSFRVDRILNWTATEHTFDRPPSFSAADFFMNHILSSAEHPQSLKLLTLTGQASSLDHLCQHWFLGHHVKDRSPDTVTFELQETDMHNAVPYLFFPYGTSIQVVEPERMKQRMLEVLQEMMNHYQA
ncbi:helix-turn-helix transcriptional regulator [Paenibacillus lemnae]|uniref:YafY family transcriptional regulator n=1 Tax=Paenibacillus lemnae TaxID=1330551 RepID=A0A848M2I6_PAELE|nr:YafY family protein [Paenibacillus lemnae]NMO94479.1 YafY family transcriptional regulator [Paenibacillus lemnae]